MCNCDPQKSLPCEANVCERFGCVYADYAYLGGHVALIPALRPPTWCLACVHACLLDQHHLHCRLGGGRCGAQHCKRTIMHSNPASKPLQAHKQQAQLFVHLRVYMQGLACVCRPLLVAARQPNAVVNLLPRDLKSACYGCPFLLSGCGG